MAAILEALAKACECPVCLGTTKEPRMLPCQHAFCLGCLQDVYDQAVRENPADTDLVCPMCKAPASLPGGLVANLPADFRANQVLEILQKEKDKGTIEESSKSGEREEENEAKWGSDKRKCCFCIKNGISMDATIFCIGCAKVFCGECHGRHRKRAGNHVYSSVNTEDILGLLCQEHDEDFIQYFCLTCERGICSSCSVDSHTEHEIDYFTPESTSDYANIMSSINEKGKRLETMQQEITLLEKKEQIHVENVKERVQQHKEHLIQELEDGARDVFSKIEGNAKKNVAELERIDEVITEAQERLSKLRNRYRMAKEPVPEMCDLSLKKSEVIFAKQASDGVADMVYTIPDLPVHMFVPNRTHKLGLYDVNLPSSYADQIHLMLGKKSETTQTLCVKNESTSTQTKYDDESREEGILHFTVNNISKLEENGPVYSLPYCVRNLQWTIRVKVHYDASYRKHLDVHLKCNGDVSSNSWSCDAVARYKLLSHLPHVKPYSRTNSKKRCYEPDTTDWGYSKYMTWNKLFDPGNGYVKNDSINIEIHVKADEPRNVSWK